MRTSQKSNRNRNKGNRPKGMGNVVNRVFESAGPEGKVRGTPQQIIEKYELLARDSQTAGDRVASENFLQHAEHYLRLLSAAQAEREARRDPGETVQPDASDGAFNGKATAVEQPAADLAGAEQPDLVETPESKSTQNQSQNSSEGGGRPRRRSRPPRRDRSQPDAGAQSEPNANGAEPAVVAPVVADAEVNGEAKAPAAKAPRKAATPKPDLAPEATAKDDGAAVG